MCAWQQRSGSDEPMNIQGLWRSKEKDCQKKKLAVL
jgi:hypothetical protein